MRYFAFLAAAAIVALAAFASLRDPAEPAESPRPAGEPARVGLWVWRGDVVTHLGERAKLFRTCDALLIDAVYLSLNRAERAALLRDDPEPLHAFIAACSRRAIAVELLISENSWVDPEKRTVFERALDDLIRYQRGARPSERFCALHLDVEPHALPTWKTDAQARLAAGLVSLVDDAGRARLPVNVDVPCWYEKIRVGETNLLAALVGAADGICVMNYRTALERFLRDGEREIELALEHDKQVVLGMSVEPTLGPRLAFRSTDALLAFRRAAREALAPQLRRPRFAIQSYRHAKRLVGLE